MLCGISELKPNPLSLTQYSFVVSHSIMALLQYLHAFLNEHSGYTYVTNGEK